MLALALLVVWLPAQSPSTTDPGVPPEVENWLPPVSQPPQAMRVVTFNVHYAPDVPALAESIRSSPALRAADLFLLQEIENHPQEGTSRARRLAHTLGLNFVYAPARRTPDGGTHGLAVLSRFPLSDIEVLLLPHYDLGARTRRRIALGVTVDVAGRPLRLYNLHLDTRINLADRLEQLRPVVEAAQRHPLEQVIVGGDFNTNPFRWAWRRIPVFRSDQAGAVDAFMKERGFAAPLAETGSTTRRRLWRVRLDSLYTRGLASRGFEVERGVEASDHFPVWLELAWPPSARQEPTAGRQEPQPPRPPDP